MSCTYGLPIIFVMFGPPIGPTSMRACSSDRLKASASRSADSLALAFWSAVAFSRICSAFLLNIAGSKGPKMTRHQGLHQMPFISPLAGVLPSPESPPALIFLLEMKLIICGKNKFCDDGQQASRPTEAPGSHRCSIIAPEQPLILSFPWGINSSFFAWAWLAWLAALPQACLPTSSPP